MAIREFHVTIYAVVDESDEIVRWEVCNPGGEPVDSDEQVFNRDTDEWERNVGQLENGTNKEWIWDKIDSLVADWVRKIK
jgi:hypothetical protein